MKISDTGIIIVDTIIINHLEKILNPNKIRVLPYDIFAVCNNIIVGFGNNVYKDNCRLLISTVEKFTKELENESS